MAKPLGAKTLLIREAIKAHVDKGNKEIAELINGAQERKDDKIKVTPQDVAAQKQAMKKSPKEAAPEAASEATERPSKPARKKPGRKATAGSTSPQARTPSPAITPDVFAHVEAIREAVRKLGADQVHRIVGLFE